MSVANGYLRIEDLRWNAFNESTTLQTSVESYMAGNKETKTKNIDEVNISELRSDFESDVAELLERLPIGQVIGMAEAPDWKKKTEKTIEAAEAEIP